MKHGTSASRISLTGLSLLFLQGGVSTAVAGMTQQAPPVSRPMAAPRESTAPRWATAAAPLVFRGITVIDVRDGRYLPDQTVMVVGPRVRALGPAGLVRVPQRAWVVDARGKYLIPGLWDMHVHPQDRVDIAFPLFIANGIIGVRDAGSSVPLATLVQWKRKIAQGLRVGPRYLVSGPALDDQPSSYPHHLGGLDTPERARQVVDSLAAAGVDFIKTYSLSDPIYFAIAREARRLGIPFGGHLPNASWAAASDSGARFIDHTNMYKYREGCGEVRGDGPTPYDARQCAAVAQRLRRNGTWGTFIGSGLLFPALLYQQMRRYSITEDSTALLAELRERPNFAQSMPTSITDWSAAAKDSATGAVKSCSIDWRLEEAAGMPELIGTDADPEQTFGWVFGFSVYNALANLVVCGMTPLGALQVATLNAALALHAADSLGTVAAGKMADLVVLDADPLADIWNTTKIRAVVANGRYFDRAALDGLLSAAEQAARRRRP